MSRIGRSKTRNIDAVWVSSVESGWTALPCLPEVEGTCQNTEIYSQAPADKQAQKDKVPTPTLRNSVTCFLHSQEPPCAPAFFKLLAVDTIRQPTDLQILSPGARDSGSIPRFLEGPIISMKVTQTLWIGCSHTWAIFKIPGARCASSQNTGVQKGSQSLSAAVKGRGQELLPQSRGTPKPSTGPAQTLQPNSRLERN